MTVIRTMFRAGEHSDLMSYFSVHYLVFFLPFVIVLYAALPRKGKKYGLLAASLLFFWLISGKLIVYLLLSAVSIWGFGLWMERIFAAREEAVKAAEKTQRKAIKKVWQRKAQLVLTLAVCLHVGLLLVLKYSAFFLDNVNGLLRTDIPIPKFLLPIGISFFTMQAVSYLADVYRRTIPADRNFLRILLYLAFFPQIVEGPICRYSQTAEQLWNVEQIEFENLTLGIQRILYGMMKQLVIASRLDAALGVIFRSGDEFEGGIIALAAVFYTIELYMDFSGTMDAVCGTAQIFGITMPENFRRPFFSKTVSEFWTRWHITLGAFFKDYIFYPVTMSKPLKNLTSSARRKLGNHFGPLISSGIALFCVWFCNGLWHGSAWNFIAFGMYHFAIIFTGNFISPWVKEINARLHINPLSRIYQTLQILRTSILVVIGELIFRAPGLSIAYIMLRKIVTNFSFTKINQQLMNRLIMDEKDFIIIGVTLAIVFAVSLMNEKGLSVREELGKKSKALRWGVLLALILYIIIFGAYGYGYEPMDPIYANF